jgi:hypothetical protein
VNGLNDRIRRIAREEVTGKFTSPNTTDTDPVSELRKELGELAARVEELEKAAAAAPAAKRTARKTASEPGE